jgi:L,D-peptidoglycan transpeptidase YkuD (ErfK/YbiS/YcfS/YnhG family)
MNKNILSFALAALLLSGCAIKQQIVVRQDSSNIQKAVVELYENNSLVASYSAQIGRNGVAKSGEKREGDGKTPSGNFPITTLFGKETFLNTTMPFIKAEASIYCVDDTKSRYYNRIVDAQMIEKDFDSFEYILRGDGQYDIGAVIGYNEANEAGKGSCIFMHIQKDSNSPTAGCVALSKEDLSSLLNRLDISKNPHIEIKP